MPPTRSRQRTSAYDDGYSQRAPCKLDGFVESPVERPVATPASRDNFFGPGGVVDQVGALVLARIGQYPGADIADLVGDLDQLGMRRFVRGIGDLPLTSLCFRQAHIVGHLDHEIGDARAELLG